LGQLLRKISYIDELYRTYYNNIVIGGVVMRQAMDLKKIKISIIVPVYNEASNVEAMYNKIKKVFETLPAYDWELLFVNDGSSDNSWQAIENITQNDNRACGLSLSRNFGKEIALTAGVESISDADAVITIDADLQHPPEKIPDFIRKWRNGSDIVVGIRNNVAGHSLLKKIGSKVFYTVMKLFSDVDIPPNSTDFRLLDKKIIETLHRFSERTRMFRGLIDWMGFNKTFLEFSAPARLNGYKPSYSYKKLFHLAINSITSFSLFPLRITAYLGLLVSTVSGLLLIYMIITDFFDTQLYTPQAYLIVINTHLVGILLSAMGLIALYIGNIHTEVVGRPLYIVCDQVGKKRTNYVENILYAEEKKNIKIGT
jgi:dolichol-phosphate mannosyltransferase